MFKNGFNLGKRGFLRAPAKIALQARYYPITVVSVLILSLCWGDMSERTDYCRTPGGRAGINYLCSGIASWTRGAAIAGAGGAAWQKVKDSRCRFPANMRLMNTIMAGGDEPRVVS